MDGSGQAPPSGSRHRRPTIWNVAYASFVPRCRTRRAPPPRRHDSTCATQKDSPCEGKLMGRAIPARRRRQLGVTATAGSSPRARAALNFQTKIYTPPPSVFKINFSILSDIKVYKCIISISIYSNKIYKSSASTHFGDQMCFVFVNLGPIADTKVQLWLPLVRLGQGRPNGQKYNFLQNI
jgi:hypothetical protein